MSSYYIYRYIDEKTKKIMYIGKTGRYSVKDRLNQHIDDSIGKWAKDNAHYIEFIELPKEEDMNYIESYLIRKFVPPCNTIFADGTKAPPFEITIKEELWKNLDDYERELKEKEEFMKTVSQNSIGGTLELMKISNEEFQKNLYDFLKTIDKDYKDMLRFIFSNYQATQGQIQIPTIVLERFVIGKTHKEIKEYLLNLSFYGKIQGTAGEEGISRFFVEVDILSSTTTMKLGENAHLLIKKLVI